MNRLAALISAAALVIGVPTAAHAEGDVDPDTAPADLPRSRIGVTVGLATPSGEVGVEYTRVLGAHLELGVGVGLASLLGVGRSLTPDPQIAVMPRVRRTLGPGTLTLGAGLSAGRYTVLSSPFASDDYVARTNALWLNGEAGYEVRARSGPFVRLALGVGAVIAHGAVKDADGAARASLPDRVLPNLGLTLGYAF